MQKQVTEELTLVAKCLVNKGEREDTTFCEICLISRLDSEVGSSFTGALYLALLSPVLRRLFG